MVGASLRRRAKRRRWWLPTAATLALVAGSVVGVILVRRSRGTFDPIAFIPEARAAARTLEPDAGLIRIDLPSVKRDGSVDFPKRGDAVEFTFRSPARGAPSKYALWPCLVVVFVNRAGAVMTERKDSTDCTERLIDPPKCTLEQVMNKAATHRVDRLRYAYVTWDGVWGVNAEFEVASLPMDIRDDCE
jgi:hypothetical protein